MRTLDGGDGGHNDSCILGVYAEPPILHVTNLSLKEQRGTGICETLVCQWTALS